MMLALRLLIILAFILQSNTQNYCARKLCRDTHHIACNNSGRWASGCNGRIINVRPHINLIVQMHNKRRNLVAAGSLSNLPSASQMATMSWDDELARLAVYNAITCRSQRDECRSTNSYRFAGQNLGGWNTRFVNVRAFLRKQIREWFNESNMTTVDDIRFYKPRPGPTFQHFTAMVHERNNRIGCAIAEFTMSMNDNTLLVCNYAVTNMIGYPIYTIGRPASSCRTGSNSRYPSLCTVNETYNHNQWLSVG